MALLGRSKRHKPVEAVTVEVSLDGKHVMQGQVDGRDWTRKNDDVLVVIGELGPCADVMDRENRDSNLRIHLPAHHS